MATWFTILASCPAPGAPTSAFDVLVLRWDRKIRGALYRLVVTLTAEAQRASSVLNGDDEVTSGAIHGGDVDPREAGLVEELGAAHLERDPPPLEIDHHRSLLDEATCQTFTEVIVTDAAEARPVRRALVRS